MSKSNLALETWKMEFGLGRSNVLKVLADAMDVDQMGAGAFLGRFQHLQRLRLVEGINPGRGKQAEYRAHQILVIAIAMQLLQLGLTPERAVRIIKENQDRVRLAISLAVPSPDEFGSAFLYLDPALLTELGSEDPANDVAERTFHYAGPGTLREMIEDALITHDVPRMAIINVRGTILSVTSALHELAAPDFGTFEERYDGALPAAYHRDLYEWVKQSSPDSLE